MDKLVCPLAFPGHCRVLGATRDTARHANRRIPGVDALRGLTMAFMILVSAPGDPLQRYALLRHAWWDGFTPVDMIFPFFLFLVGVSVALSLGRRLADGSRGPDVVRHAAKRAAILFGLGLLVNGFPYFDLATLRIPGVLQRIGLVSLLATLVALRSSSRAMAGLIAVLLLGYWILLAGTPVPDWGPPDLSIQNGNIAAWVDGKLLGGHLWVQENEWDPEGLLSTMPALAMALAGVLAGRELGRRGDGAEAIRCLGPWSMALTAVGLAWGLVFPFNRWLWTSSFILFACGAALGILAGCLWASQQPAASRAVTFFRIYGENAITLYVASSLVSRAVSLIPVSGGQTLQEAVMESLSAWLSPENAALVLAACFTLAFFGLALALHRRGIRIRI